MRPEDTFQAHSADTLEAAIACWNACAAGEGFVAHRSDDGSVILQDAGSRCVVMSTHESRMALAEARRRVLTFPGGWHRLLAALSTQYGLLADNCPVSIWSHPGASLSLH